MAKPVRGFKIVKKIEMGSPDGSSVIGVIRMHNEQGYYVGAAPDIKGMEDYGTSKADRTKLPEVIEELKTAITNHFLVSYKEVIGINISTRRWATYSITHGLGNRCGVFDNELFSFRHMFEDENGNRREYGTDGRPGAVIAAGWSSNVFPIVIPYSEEAWAILSAAQKNFGSTQDYIFKGLQNSIARLLAVGADEFAKEHPSTSLTFAFLENAYNVGLEDEKRKREARK